MTIGQNPGEFAVGHEKALLFAAAQEHVRSPRGVGGESEQDGIVLAPRLAALGPKNRAVSLLALTVLTGPSQNHPHRNGKGAVRRVKMGILFGNFHKKND